MGKWGVQVVKQAMFTNKQKLSRAILSDARGHVQTSNQQNDFEKYYLK